MKLSFRLLLLGLFTASFLLQVASALLGDSPQLIASDGKAYYAWVRSVVVDHDLDFRNDYELLCPPDPLPAEYLRLTPAGGAPNKYPIGLPLLEAPAVLFAHALASVLPNFPADGVSAPYQFSVSLWLIALTVLALGTLRTTLVRAGGEPGVAAVLVILMVVATNLLHYLAKEPTMSHAAGVAVTCFVLWLISSRPEGRSGSGRDLAVGALVGLLLLIRNSNVALLPFLATALWLHGGARALLRAGATAIVVSLLQPVALSLQWGELRWLMYSDEGFTGAPTGLWASLFHVRHGLFLYHPYYLVLLGLVVGAARDRESRALAIAALVSFLGLVVVNGSWWCWWFGYSFGNRAYIEILPILTLAAGSGLSLSGRTSTFRRVSLVASAVLVSLNLWLWGGYLLQRYPHDGVHSLAAAYVWPFQK